MGNTRQNTYMYFTTMLFYGACSTLIECNAADGRHDHYIMVDLGEKRYNFYLDENNGTEQKKSGVFKSSVVVSPTALISGGDEENGRFYGLFGLSFGFASDDDIKYQSYEWQLGLGAMRDITEWAHLAFTISGGYGVTGVEIPAYWPTISGDHSDWNFSGHGEATVGLTFDIDHVSLLAQFGYRVTQLRLTDYELDRSAQYVVHGMVAAIGIGLTY